MARLIIDSINMRCGVEGTGTVYEIDGWLFQPGMYPTDIASPSGHVPDAEQQPVTVQEDGSLLLTADAPAAPAAPVAAASPTEAAGEEAAS